MLFPFRIPIFSSLFTLSSHFFLSSLILCCFLCRACKVFLCFTLIALWFYFLLCKVHGTFLCFALKALCCCFLLCKACEIFCVLLLELSIDVSCCAKFMELFFPLLCKVCRASPFLVMQNLQSFLFLVL